MTERHAIGDLVRLKRKENDWSQAELGRRAGVHEKTVQRLELGKQVAADSIADIAAALHWTPELLENYEENEAAELLRRLEATRAMVGAAENVKQLEDRITAMIASPPEGYRITAWTTPDGVYRIEFWPIETEDRLTNAGPQSVSNVDRQQASSRRRTGTRG